ncbi:MAG: ATP-binding protein [Candidatus Latescibacterota bacterium]|nr:ATP-binding protein [Candidatus Latescibacterota bacterium]
MSSAELSPSSRDTPVSCSDCGGVGLRYDPRVEVGRFGTLGLCHCQSEQCCCDGRPPHQYWDDDHQRQWCPCHGARRRLAQVTQLFRNADIPTRFRFKFRNDFQATGPDGSALLPARRVQPVIDYLAALLADDREPQRGYLFHGPPGTGKTLLACIVLNELLLHRVRPGRFVNLSRKFFQQLRDTYSQDSEQYGRTWQILEEMCNVPYLVLDDFGVQRGTDWEMEMLYDLVDARYGDERLTMVTSNQSIAEIEELSGGRICSRLIEMCYVVDMQGQDYRQYMLS